MTNGRLLAMDRVLELGVMQLIDCSADWHTPANSEYDPCPTVLGRLLAVGFGFGVGVGVSGVCGGIGSTLDYRLFGSVALNLGRYDSLQVYSYIVSV
jgi:hypothetical protein